MEPNTEPNTEPNPEPQEIKNILDEALSCTTCNPPISSTPTVPYATNMNNDDDDEDVPVSPHSTNPPPRKKGFIDLMTDVQKQRYMTQVISHIDADMEALREAGLQRNEREMDEALIRAFWRVEYHISLHYRVGKGILGFCRDERDLGELGSWLGDVYAGESRIGDEGEGGKGRKRKRDAGTGFSRWVECQEMSDMVAILRSRWKERKERIERVRSWMSAMRDGRGSDGGSMDS